MTPSRPEGAAPQGAKPPSAAALRAARKWYPGEPEPTELAEVIDRETCLPELQKALLRAMDHLDCWALKPPPKARVCFPDNRCPACLVHEDACAALRLAEQGREGK